MKTSLTLIRSEKPEESNKVRISFKTDGTLFNHVFTIGEFESLSEQVRHFNKSSNKPAEYRLAVCKLMLDNIQDSNKRIRSIAKKLGIFPYHIGHSSPDEQDKYVSALLTLAETIPNNANMVAQANKLYYSFE